MHHDGDFIKILLFVGFILFKIISGFFKKAATGKELPPNPSLPPIKPARAKRLTPTTKPLIHSDNLLEEALGKRKISTFPQTIPSEIPSQPVKIEIPKFIPPLSPVQKSQALSEKTEQVLREIKSQVSEPLPLPQMPEISPLLSPDSPLLKKAPPTFQIDLIANLRDPKKIKHAFLLQEIFGEAPGLRSFSF